MLCGLIMLQAVTAACSDASPRIQEGGREPQVETPAQSVTAPPDQGGLTHPIHPVTDEAPTLSFKWGGGREETRPETAAITPYGQWLDRKPFKYDFAPGTGIALHVTASYRPYYSTTGGTVVAIQRKGDQGGTVAVRYGRRYAVVHRYVDGIPSDLQEGDIIAPGTRLGYLGENGDFYSWAVELIELQDEGVARTLPPFGYFDAPSQAVLERVRQAAPGQVPSWTAATRSVRDGWPALVGDLHWWADPDFLGYGGNRGQDMEAFLAEHGLTWLLYRSPEEPPTAVLAARNGGDQPRGPERQAPQGPAAPQEPGETPVPPASSPPPEPWPWVDGVMVQPLPPHAAGVRLVLPASLEHFTFVTDPANWGLGGFGLHAGGHVEGLDHVWLSLQEGTKVGSWADGVVTEVNWAGEEWHITIDYGNGLKGWHGEVKTPLVKVGDTVKAGEPVAEGLSFHSGSVSAEFGLYDANRADGDDASSTAGWVSPFDYLRAEDQQAFLAAYRRHIVDPYLAGGKSVGYIGPWEPYLTNRAMIHPLFKGKLPGEWVKTAPGSGNEFPDFLTLLEVETPYFKGRRVESEKIGEGPPPVRGTWEADYSAGRIRFDTEHTTYYGLFHLDESGPRAKLKLEYRQGSYPEAFSERAAVYTERSELRPGEDPVG